MAAAAPFPVSLKVPYDAPYQISIFPQRLECSRHRRAKNNCAHLQKATHLALCLQPSMSFLFKQPIYWTFLAFRCRITLCLDSNTQTHEPTNQHKEYLMHPKAEFYFACKCRNAFGAKIPNPSKHGFTVSALQKEVALVPVKTKAPQRKAFISSQRCTVSLTATVALPFMCMPGNTRTEPKC